MDEHFHGLTTQWATLHAQCVAEGITDRDERFIRWCGDTGWFVLQRNDQHGWYLQDGAETLTLLAFITRYPYRGE